MSFSVLPYLIYFVIDLVGLVIFIVVRSRQKQPIITAGTGWLISCICRYGLDLLVINMEDPYGRAYFVFWIRIFVVFDEFFFLMMVLSFVRENVKWRRRGEIEMASAPWVEIDRVNGKTRWEILDFRLLDPDENGGRHSVFVSAVRDGKEIRDGSVSIKWGWKDQKIGEEASPPVKMVKSPPSLADIPIFGNAEVWVEIDDGLGTPSDRAKNLMVNFDGSNHPGDRFGHHSYLVKFQKTTDGGPPTTPTILTLEQRVGRIEEKLGIV
jgi:hypothetical protein